MKQPMMIKQELPPRCPLRRMKRCRPDCAWFSGKLCAMLMIGVEAYALVEVMGQGKGKPQQPEGDEPCETS